MFRISRTSALVLQAFFWILFFHCQSCDGQWVAPDAWGRASKDSAEIVHSKSSSTVSPSGQCDICTKDRDAELAALFYSKFVKFIFDRNRMKFDPSEEMYSRAIVFKATPRQLEMLEQSDSPRECDRVLSELLPNAKVPDQTFQNSMINDIYTSAKQLFIDVVISSEIRFGLLFLLAVIALIYLKREYKYGIVATICAGSFTFGLVHAYYDCNKELEISQYVEALHGKENPCDYIEQSTTIFSWSYFFRKNSKQECIEYLKNKDKIQMPYCRPDEVFMKYINELFFNQMYTFADKSTNIFRKCFDLGFPYNIVAMLVFGLTLIQIVKLTFKYILGPLVWKQIHLPKIGSRKQSVAGDQLSGENLKLFLESMKHKEQAQSDLAKIAPLLAKESLKQTQLPQLTGAGDQKECEKEPQSPKKMELEKEPQSPKKKESWSDGEDEIILSNGNRTSSVEEVP